MKRRLDNWLASFHEYVRQYKVPRIFSEWTGRTIISGTLMRDVWTFNYRGFLYPNQYVLLVGPPGGGKTMNSVIAGQLWRAIGVPVIPPNVTGAALADALKNAQIDRIHKGKHVAQYNYVNASSNEFGTLMSAYDEGFMATLTDIYDGEEFGEGRRGNKEEPEWVLDNAQMTILACTQPKNLNNFLPDIAWDQGFMSRVVNVFSPEISKVPLYTGDIALSKLERARAKLKDDLINDLLWMREKYYGEMMWDGYEAKESAALFDAWIEADCPPSPRHPKLLNYSTRRVIHCLKNTMITTVADGREEMTTNDFHTTLNLMVETEAAMPTMFKAMAASDDYSVIQEVLWQCTVIWASKRDGQPINEDQIRTLLMERVDAYKVESLFKVMCAAGYLICTGGAWYRPKLDQDEPTNVIPIGSVKD